MGNSSSGGAVAILRSLFDIALNLQNPLALAYLGYHQQIFCAHHFQKNILRNSLSKKPFEVKSTLSLKHHSLCCFTIRGRSF